MKYKYHDPDEAAAWVAAAIIAVAGMAVGAMIVLTWWLAQ